MTCIFRTTKLDCRVLFSLIENQQVKPTQRLMEDIRMRIRIPSEKIREKVLLIYELEGCHKAVDFLTEYYGVRRTRIRLNGRKVGNGDGAVYFENKAYFTKRGLKKRTVLHELYHHLVCSKGLEMPTRTEEKEANSYAKEVLGSHN